MRTNGIKTDDAIKHINAIYLFFSNTHTRTHHLRAQLYTQYMPLSVHELKSWAGTPTIFVLDCSAAGVLMPHFVQPLSSDDNEMNRTDPQTPPSDGGSLPGSSSVGGGAVAAGQAAAAAGAAAAAAAGQETAEVGEADLRSSCFVMVVVVPDVLDCFLRVVIRESKYGIVDWFCRVKV